MEKEKQSKKLYLSDTDKKVSGVLGGISEYLGLDSTFVRVIFLLFLVLTAVFPMVIFYLLALAVMPRRS